MRAWQRLVREALPSLAAVALALFVGGVLVWLAGVSPLLAFAALIEGAFSSWDSVSEVGVKSCPLLLTGLAVVAAFRAGVWNIGAEGQLLVGAAGLVFAAKYAAPRLPEALALPLGLACAALAGSLWAAVPAALKVRRNVNEVIATIMLNFIAASLLSYLVQGPLMEAGGRYPQSDAVPASMLLPRLAPYRLHAGLLLAFVAAIALHVWFFFTRRGFEMRAAGSNPAAAMLAGIPVQRTVFLAFCLSGALAGLAGGVEVAGVTRRIYERFSPGWGFTAIAVGLLARLSPLGAIFSAFFFGALDAGSNSMQRVAGVSAVLVQVIQGCVILFLAAFEFYRRRTRRPE
jgi:simple sugar transport system permease protein